MVKLKYNVKGAEHDKNSTDAGGDRPLPPAAVYPARIAKCDYAEPEGKNPRLEVEFRLIDKDHKDYPLWDYIVWVDPKTDKETFDKNKWKTDQFLQALGIDTAKKESGDFDTDEAVGKLVKVRLKHETDARDKQNIKTRARPGGAFYYDPDDDDSFQVDEDDVTGPFDDAEPDVNDGVTTEGDETDWSEYPLADVGETADGDDAGAVEFLTALAGEYGIDPNAIDTWAEVAEQVEAAIAEAEAAKAAAPAKKGAAKKAAAPAKKAAGKAAAAPKEAAEEYGEEWSLDDLKAELTSRKLPTRGPRTALVNRLKENDGDPFSGSEE